jgi:glycosyltransferase involved in cell wall biosynthesis
VTTTVGAEGFDSPGDLTPIVADDPRQFAAAVVAIYDDGQRWERASTASAQSAARFSRQAVGKRLAAVFGELSKPRSRALS